MTHYSDTKLNQPPDELVKEVTCHNPRPLGLHAYIAPFIAIHATFAYFMLDKLDGWSIPERNREFWFIGTAVIVVLQMLCYLSCQWSVRINCLLCYSRTRSPLQARFVKVVPTPNNGSTEICRLYQETDLSALDGKQSESTCDNKPPLVWFHFQKAKYIYNHEQHCFAPLQYPTCNKLRDYLTSKGLASSEQVRAAEQKFGKNDLKMDVPHFSELFKERVIAPFFVFQVFCMVLWCLEDYWYYSLFTLSLLVVFEVFLVQQQLRNLAEIRKMGSNEPRQLFVYRNRKWSQMMSNELLPGDLVSIGRGSASNNNNNLVPCDLLLLRGSLIVDEAMLTGESVPQMKEPVENVTDQLDRCLDLNQDSKLHVLFGGTRILQHTNSAGLAAISQLSDVPANESELATSQHRPMYLVSPANNGCLAYVLKTSFNTSQGKLLRTILFGVKRVTANTLETFCFILFLLVFAIASASYLWIEGTKDPRRSRYKLMLECIFILTSVVPPELPIELSLAVNSSLLSLSKLYIFCTEPFRIPFAGKTEICCFDKTGTLTSDSLLMEGVVGVDVNHFKSSKSVSQLQYETVQVLASCHSLAQLDEGLVGDPLEKATLNAIEWQLAKSDLVMPKKGKAPGLRILQRFHFSSALKRMSVIASYTDPGTREVKLISTVKGAPEVIKEMLTKVPEQYDETYTEISRKGGRVIALARKNLPPSRINEAKEMKREEIESDLEFAGFAVLTCPLKPDTKKVIKEIVDSSHAVMMITGDAPLTACYIAQQLSMFGMHKTPLVLCEAGGEASSETDKSSRSLCLEWRPIDDKLSLPLYPPDLKQFLNTFDLCITGESFDYLLQEHSELFQKLLPHVRVWARFAPKQKEFILTSLRQAGYYTVMCGDGTNDVGALKHAHVGIALISSTGVSKRPAQPRNLPPRQQQQQQSNQNLSRAERQQLYANRLKQMMEELEAQDNPMVKLGDASIAAPFTSRHSSIKCVCDVIKQGRCTLVTTLQMFKILALNALILAYCQSALYLDGIKFSDSQATLQGLLLAGCFLFISRSQPLKTLSKERPLPNIFNTYSILTVTSQFVVHFSSLLYLVAQAKARMPVKEDAYVDLEAEFEPSILNSTVYIISITLQVSTFAVNYKGHPFMQSMRENRHLLYSIFGSLCILFCVISGIAPVIADQFSIVPFEKDYQYILLTTLALDLLGAFLVDRFWQKLLGYGILKAELQ